MKEYLTYKQQLRPRILETAMQMFRKKGIRSVKMDDISTALGISKRTLYEIYANKEQLLLEGVMKVGEQQLVHMRQFALTGKNEMEIVAEFMRRKLDDLEVTNPQFFKDIRMYDSVMHYLQKHREENHAASIEFIRSGIKHGYFLPSINYEILINMSDVVINHLLENEDMRKYQLNEILRNFTIVLMRGFCTEKGIGIIDRYFKSL